MAVRRFAVLVLAVLDHVVRRPRALLFVNYRTISLGYRKEAACVGHCGHGLYLNGCLLDDCASLHHKRKWSQCNHAPPSQRLCEASVWQEGDDGRTGGNMNGSRMALRTLCF